MPHLKIGCGIKYSHYIILIMMSMFIYLNASGQQHKSIAVEGKIVSGQTGTPLINATVRLKGENRGVQTDKNGHFVIDVPSEEVILVSYVGYKTKEIRVTDSLSIPLTIALEQVGTSLQAVEVSTGYQLIPKERSTGSFDFINNHLLSSQVSTDVVSRLEGIANGLTFNKNKGSADNTISIRGRNTLYANAQPLIVINNFPYNGDINDINPNDVESITILKDAAAASIWGARAGNGVIVITTKEGRFNEPLKVSVNANITMGEKPDLFYKQVLSTSDFIDVEEMLFNKGFYNSAENSISHAPLTPVVELLIAKRDGTISAEDADNQINALRKVDIRKDFEKYFYRKNINQQYALNISGGSADDRYYFSAGYDNNLNNAVGNGYRRITINASNTYSLIRNKLNITTSIYYTQSKTPQNNPGYSSIDMASGMPLYPYAKLADAQGNPLPIVHDYRFSYVQASQANGLLNWEYAPLQELRNADDYTLSDNLQFNVNAAYNFSPSLKANILYNYHKDLEGDYNLYNSQSYYARDLINQFTQVNSDGSLYCPVPLGGILDQGNDVTADWNLRGQLTFSRTWGQKNSVNAIGGMEIQDVHTVDNAYRLYGYDDSHASSIPVDYITLFQKYYNPYSNGSIPYDNFSSDLTDRYISYFSNAAYTYAGKYTISASGRFDQSNLFGVKTNQRGVPLWSSGISWDMAKEAFYHSTILPYLKLRLTYGFNGNVDKSVTAYTTAQVSSSVPNYLTHLPFAKVINPPNPELRWERVRMTNLGIDFSSAKQIISGSIDGYLKRGLDLIGYTPVAPSTGLTQFQGNTADTKGKGIDVQLHTRNINRRFKWTTTFLFTYVSDKVTNYKVKSTVSNYLQFADGGGIYPMEGRPLFALYSFRWGGLDPATGDPQGYLNGKISKDYASIVNSTKLKDLVYNGPARPPLFGSLQNSFSWNGFSLSFNIIYRLGYYFRRSSISYSSLLNGLGGSPEYDKRWMKPGDEKKTNVPSLPAQPNNYRDQVYLYSEVLVEKAGNVRLHDISLQYNFSKMRGAGHFLKNLQVYLYANNMGILWKANHSGLDPDYLDLKPTKQFSIGIKTDF